MHNAQLHTAVSVARFNRYLFACGGNLKKAYQLYKANLILSQKMYAVVGIFEVVLRNSIDRHFCKLKGENWLEDAVGTGGYLDTTPGCERSFHSVQEAIYKLDKKYTHDGLIAGLSFGFWTYQFSKKEFAATGNTLLEIFPKKPFGVNQKTIFQNLFKINEIRNRIAHYEPICFDEYKISSGKALKQYNLIKEMLDWLGCDTNQILSNIDGVMKAIGFINSIANYMEAHQVQVNFKFKPPTLN